MAGEAPPPSGAEGAGEGPAGRDPADERAAAVLDALAARLRDGIIETAIACGTPVARVRRDAWRRAAEVAKTELDCDFLSFISGIDWRPAPRAEGGDGGDTSAPVQPTEMTFGAAGAAGRFQVFAHVESTTRRYGVTLKVDVDEAEMRVASWVPVYGGADWHERECWEMFGVVFDGHPSLRRLYLPAEFEGHPLRKDFPLLARDVKPWPGLVDVEGMPGEADAGTSGGGAEAGEVPA